MPSPPLVREHHTPLMRRWPALAGAGLVLPVDACLFSSDPVHAAPWNPDWASHRVADLAATAGVRLTIKGLRHYTASQLLAARFGLRSTAAR